MLGGGTLCSLAGYPSGMPTTYDAPHFVHHGEEMFCV